MKELFTDPFLRAPLWASSLMCLTSALIGVVVVLRKRALIAETLSHASYPGITLALMSAAFLELENFSLWILGGAFIAAYLGSRLVDFLEKNKVSEDAALTFVLASFFGMGTLIASVVQSTFPNLLGQIYAYLFGKVATLQDFHILIYGIFALFTVIVLALFSKELKMALFDREYGFTTGTISAPIDRLINLLTLLAVVIGIRSCGLVLISAMIIIPSIFAKVIANNFFSLFILAGSVALLSAFSGTLLSVYLSNHFALSFPVGALIVLLSAFFTLLAHGIFFKKQRVSVG